MDPQQTPPPAYPGGYPPQTPPPADPYAAPAPGQFAAQPPQQPQPIGQPQAAPYTPPQPHTPRPAPQPASWYTPPPKPDVNRPADVNSYLQAAGVPAPGQYPQPGAAPAAPSNSTVPGQIIDGKYSVDYLDQMAAAPKQPLDKKYLFIGAGVLVALILAAFLLFASPKNTSTANEVKLYSALIDVEASTTRSGKLIKNSKLAAINSNMRTSLLNAARDMETPLTNMGLQPSKLKSAAKKPPYHDDKLVTSLEDARLNGIYDRVYANEMNTKTKYIIAYMNSIKKKNSRKSMQEFIAKNEPSFQTVQKSIDDFQNSDEANLY